MPTLRLGTRGSLLATSQSALVAAEIQRLRPDVQIETIIIKTTGDQITDRPLHESGGKGLFVKELEQALLDDKIDFAVHSCKDLPVTQPLVDESDLVLAAIPKREDPRDVLISTRAKSISELPRDAAVATGSLRRRCQLLALRPDLKILPLRGNIDTRINKLKAGEADAIVLAFAGVMRASLIDPTIMHIVPLDDLLPAPGQAAIGLQCRYRDDRTGAILGRLDDLETNLAVKAERAVVAALNCDCHSPIAVYAQFQNHTLRVRAALGQRDGNPPVKTAEAQGMNAVEHIVRQLSI
jgi:hydroxymethylbilane synthase